MLLDGAANFRYTIYVYNICTVYIINESELPKIDFTILVTEKIQKLNSNICTCPTPKFKMADILSYGTDYNTLLKKNTEIKNA